MPARNRTAGSSSRTARQLLDWSERRIRRTDAEYMMQMLLGRPRHDLYFGPTQLSARQVTRFLGQVERVAESEPVEYVLGRARFLDFDLAVNRRVLIPRSETEELVARILARVAHRPGLRVLDLGTGSGCIAIALARAWPGARVLATDVSKPALALARQNVTSLGLGARVTLKQADLFSGLGRRRFDVIVANLPYVPGSLLAGLDRSVHREPRRALDAGADGMRYLGPVLRQAERFLNRDGLLALEIDPAVMVPIRLEWPMAVIEKDLAGFDRYLFADSTQLAAHGKPRADPGDRR
jgi:release factor-specific protein-(glutamine-N5) methyltransferase